MASCACCNACCSTGHCGTPQTRSCAHRGLLRQRAQPVPRAAVRVAMEAHCWEVGLAVAAQQTSLLQPVTVRQQKGGSSCYCSNSSCCSSNTRRQQTLPHPHHIPSPVHLMPLTSSLSPHPSHLPCSSVVYNNTQHICASSFSGHRAGKASSRAASAAWRGIWSAGAAA